MEFVVRKMEDGDLNFLLNSWLLSARRWSSVGDTPHYFADTEPRLKEILANTQVLVVCNSDQPEQIFGWVCFDSRFRLVHFVYVKRRWRKMGLAKQLMDATQMDAQYCTTCSGVDHPLFTYVGVTACHE